MLSNWSRTDMYESVKFLNVFEKHFQHRSVRELMLTAHVLNKRKQSVKYVGHVYYRNRKDGFILKK